MVLKEWENDFPADAKEKKEELVENINGLLNGSQSQEI